MINKTTMSNICERLVSLSHGHSLDDVCNRKQIEFLLFYLETWTRCNLCRRENVIKCCCVFRSNHFTLKDFSELGVVLLLRFGPGGDQEKINSICRSTSSTTRQRVGQ